MRRSALGLELAVRPDLRHPPQIQGGGDRVEIPALDGNRLLLGVERQKLRFTVNKLPVSELRERDGYYTAG